MDNLKVSIIMPCHNGANYIEKAINSVIAQTYIEWELIIIDDNSTDNSVLIANKYVNSDSRIKCLRNENNTGMPASPRNIGIKEAKGRYIAFLDCDDVWLANKLENQIKLFDERTSVVYSYYKKMDEKKVYKNISFFKNRKYNILSPFNNYVSETHIIEITKLVVVCY